MTPERGHTSGRLAPARTGSHLTMHSRSRGFAARGMSKSEGARAPSGRHPIAMPAAFRRPRRCSMHTRSVPLVPPGCSEPGSRRSRDLGRLRFANSSVSWGAARDGLPCGSLWRSHASHGRWNRTASHTCPGSLRELPRDDAANGAAPPQAGHRPCPALALKLAASLSGQGCDEDRCGAARGDKLLLDVCRGPIVAWLVPAQNDVRPSGSDII